MDGSKYLELHHLRREVLSARDRGRVVIEFADGAAYTNVNEVHHLADQMLVLVNLPMLGPHWFSADRDRAASIVTAVLHWDLETLKPRVPQKQAESLTQRIFGQFSGECVYLTNVRPKADITKSPHRWASGSELAELDAGVAIVSKELVGLLWVEDRP
jgi:hypothetical protein